MAPEATRTGESAVTDSRMPPVSRIGPLLPRLVLEAPARSVFACQGTLLHVRLEGLLRLVSAFESGGPTGAAELERLLGVCLEEITSWIDRFGGDTLSLSPTSVQAVFPDTSDIETSVHRSLGCALAICRSLRVFSQTASVEPVGPLSARIGVASGAIHGLLLGKPEFGRSVAFTGAAIEDARRAAQQAGEYDIVLHPSAGVRVNPEHLVTDPPLPTPAMTRLESLLVPPEPVSTRIAPDLSGVSTVALRTLVPSPLLGLLGQPRRPRFVKACTLMVAVDGIDPAAAGSLDPVQDWYGHVQEVVASFEGAILQMDLRNTVRLRIVFGAPATHSDDESRALQCTLALQRFARALPLVSNQRIGVAGGHCFAGMIGGHVRHEYGVVAERVELATRLAGIAGPWEVLVDRHTVSRAGFGFDWGPPPPAPAGSDVDIRTARALYGEGAFGAKLTSRSRGGVIGREPIMAELRDLADEAVAGHGRLVCLTGTAGIGKSALLYWVSRYLQEERKVPVYVGECGALVRQAPYHAWIPIFRRWLDLEPNLPLEACVARVAERVGALDPDLLTRLPLVGMVTGHAFPDNSSTAGLDTRRRREALHSLVLEIFQLAFRRHPVAVVFEDAHWMDQASLDLLRYLARNVSALPVFITITRRPEEPGQPEGIDALERLPSAHVVKVGTLANDALIALASRHMGAQKLSDQLSAELIERSGGVPLYLEELTLFLRDADLVQVDNEGVARLLPGPGVVIPRSIQEIILARVARLDEGAQLTLKAASVIGRTFSLSILREVYPVPFDTAVLDARIERVEGLDIVRRDADALDTMAQPGTSGPGRPPTSEDDFTFFFKHSLIRDTIYDTLTASSRRSLHEAVAAALERRVTRENQDEMVLLIAEHYRRTMCVDKQRGYYRKAGDVALGRGLNREANDYYRAAEELCLLAGDREGAADVLEAQVGVLNLLGDRDAQREAIARWQQVAQELGDNGRFADTLRAEGALLARSGEPLKGLKTLQRARRIVRTMGDPLREARILRVISRVHFQRLDLPAALEAAEQALALTADLSDWQEIVSDEANIGTILTRMNQVDEGRKKLEAALRLAQEQGDVRLSGIILSNLGVLENQEGRIDHAMSLWERALVLKRQVGERQEEVVTLGNLSLAWLCVGGYERARDYGLDARSIARQIEERWAEGNICQTLGLVYTGLGDSDTARTFLSEAIEIARGCDAAYVEVEALEGLAKLHLGTGRLEAAEEAITRALHIGGHRTVHLHALHAWVAARRDDRDTALRALEDAKEALENASPRLQSMAVARYHVARACHALGVPGAWQHLSEARAELLERANRIDDEALRHQMLHAVEENRQILETWDEWHEQETVP